MKETFIQTKIHCLCIRLDDQKRNTVFPGSGLSLPSHTSLISSPPRTNSFDAQQGTKRIPAHPLSLHPFRACYRNGPAFPPRVDTTAGGLSSQALTKHPPVEVPKSELRCCHPPASLLADESLPPCAVSARPGILTQQYSYGGGVHFFFFDPLRFSRLACLSPF